jgi:hypothetical protein
VAYQAKEKGSDFTVVVEIGINAADLAIKWTTLSQADPLFEVEQLYVLDQKGLCAIVEYLPKKLNFDWQTKTTKMHQDDVNSYRHVLNLLKHFASKKMNIEDFSLKHLGLTEQGVLKTTQVLPQKRKAEYSFLQLLNLAEEASSSNEFIFLALLNHDFSNNSDMKYLSECFKKASASDPISPEILATTISPPIQDQKVIERASQISTTVRNLIVNYGNQIKSKCNVKKDPASLEALNKTIGEVLSSKYGQGLFSWNLFQNTLLQEHIIDDIIARGKYQRKNEEAKRAAATS